ncbi:MAG: phosphatidylserine decarboxylase, partial [Mycobacterium sp.]|nr:phosphatidylserine decarboxylase [Mycobacterium sp.]
MARRPRSTDENLTFGPQRLLSLLRSTVPPVHPAGLPFISAGLGLALAGRRYRWLRRAGLLTAGACAGFFRHPPRVPPTRPGVVVAPADGLICLIDSAAPPAELELGDAELPRVSIFLSLLDAHVQRAPVSGEVIAVHHRPGRFGSADLAAASDDNERISMRIRTDGGVEIVAVQIAGLL